MNRIMSLKRSKSVECRLFLSINDFSSPTKWTIKLPRNDDLLQFICDDMFVYCMDYERD